MDYFVIHKARPGEWRSVEGVNWNGPISCIAGGVVALAFPGVLVPTLNGIVVSCVLYLILYPVLSRKKAQAAAAPTVPAEETAEE